MRLATVAFLALVACGDDTPAPPGPSIDAPVCTASDAAEIDAAFCANEGELCAAHADCCLPLRCQTSVCVEPPPSADAAACVADALRCEGDTVQWCNPETLAWEDLQLCEDGCYAGSCK